MTQNILWKQPKVFSKQTKWDILQVPSHLPDFNSIVHLFIYWRQNWRHKTQHSVISIGSRLQAVIATIFLFRIMLVQFLLSLWKWRAVHKNGCNWLMHLALKLQVYTSITLWLFHFKFNVEVHRGKMTKTVIVQILMHLTFYRME